MSDSRNIADVLKDDGHRAGTIQNMPREMYDSLHRLNFSSVKEGLLGAFDVDTGMIKETYEQTRPDPTVSQQDSFDSGNLMHLIVLQPELIVDRVAVWRGGDRRGRDWETFKIEHAGKTIMKEAEVRAVQFACREFRQIPRIRELLQPCDTEVTVLVKEGPFFCKCRIDGVTRADRDLCVIVDPKTSRHGNDEHSVLTTIRKFRYREQLGIYARWLTAATGREVDAVYLLFLSLPPQRLGAAVVKITTMALEWGANRVLDAMEQLHESIETDRWPVFCGDYISDVSSFEMDDVEIEGLEA